MLEIVGPSHAVGALVWLPNSFSDILAHDVYLPTEYVPGSQGTGKWKSLDGQANPAGQLRQPPVVATGAHYGNSQAVGAKVKSLAEQ
jgi:hypothetical protein